LREVTKLRNHIAELEEKHRLLEEQHRRLEQDICADRKMKQETIDGLQEVVGDPRVSLEPE
jgi:predicted  nucleic acid-binding Zn-ribbon protein